MTVLIPVAIAVCLAVAVQASGALGGLEQTSVATRFDIRGPQKPADVAVVGVDAKTFGDLREQWPFPRSLHGRVIRRLHAAGARGIVYDVQFTEPSQPAQDESLYEAIGDVGGATLATSESDARGRTRVLGGDDNLRAVRARAGASDLGNEGRLVTRVPRTVSNLPTMAVAAAERAGAPAPPPHAFEHGGALIGYRGPAGTVPALSFSDVLRGNFPANAVRDRVVVVGATAPTLRDVHSTPLGLMSGAEVQANAIWTALHSFPLKAAPLWATLALIGLLALVAPVAVSRMGGPLALVATFAAGVVFLVAAQLAFDADRVVPVVGPLVALVSGGVGAIVASRIRERRVRLHTERANEALEERVRERTDLLWKTQLELVQRLGTAVDWRDGDTGEHVARIGVVCERLATAIGMDATEVEQLRQASVLHDVGKVGIPDHILNKPGPLDPEEWAVMKTHTTIGSSILADSASELIQLACTVALTHHENWDGTGYPNNLTGRAIPRVGRICAIADVFDALASPRPYKDPWPLEDILTELKSLRGTKFDPELLDAFLPMAPGIYAELFADAAPLTV